MKKQMLACALASLLLTVGCGDEASNASSEYVAQRVTSDAQFEVAGKFPAFTAKTLEGEAVTDQIFVGKKLTVVNCWATFCPPCIAEMPELSAWANEMSDGVQLLGLVCDVRGEDDSQTIEAARKILNDADARFLNILPSSDMQKFLSTVEVVPTTIFVDSNGNIIGAPILGADVDAYKDFVDEYLSN